MSDFIIYRKEGNKKHQPDPDPLKSQKKKCAPVFFDSVPDDVSSFRRRVTEFTLCPTISRGIEKL